MAFGWKKREVLMVGERFENGAKKIGLSLHLLAFTLRNPLGSLGWMGRVTVVDWMVGWAVEVVSWVWMVGARAAVGGAVFGAGDRLPGTGGEGVGGFDVEGDLWDEWKW